MNLKPCQVCPSRDVKLTKNAHGTWFVGCETCGNKTGYYRDWQEAVKRWNAR